MKAFLASFLLFICCGNALGDERLAGQHQHLIDAAILAAPAAAAGSLHRCQSNLALYPAKQAMFRHLLERRANVDAPVMLVEIGSEGFSRYEFMIVDGNTLKSSVRASDIDLSAPLQAAMAGLFALPELGPGAMPNVDDGACYFVSIHQGDVRRAYAFYGETAPQPLRDILNKLIKLSHQGKHTP